MGCRTRRSWRDQIARFAWHGLFLSGARPRDVGLKDSLSNKATNEKRRVLNVTLSDAKAIVDRAIASSNAIGVPMIIAVVEGGGHLISFARMDRAISGAGGVGRAGSS